MGREIKRRRPAEEPCRTGLHFASFIRLPGVSRSTGTVSSKLSPLSVATAMPSRTASTSPPPRRGTTAPTSARWKRRSTQLRTGHNGRPRRRSSQRTAASYSAHPNAAPRPHRRGGRRKPQRQHSRNGPSPTLPGQPPHPGADMSAFRSPSPTEPLSLVTVLVGRLTHVTRHVKAARCHREAARSNRYPGSPAAMLADRACESWIRRNHPESGDYAKPGQPACLPHKPSSARTEPLELSHRISHAGEAVVQLGGELDIASAEVAVSYVTDIIDRHGGAVTADLSALTFRRCPRPSSPSTHGRIRRTGGLSIPAGLAQPFTRQTLLCGSPACTTGS